ncbi:hypothetical protein C922_01646 [Plasmodium inui San Antonio 1]|uniref:Uncharacterized protein n=1 Tax=Plasmodium inui San Antonio 1 TaxID=1237626 RepID=W7AGC8_9APIC|nr:hypothetical protein C922_01646 [Plasmodium inui San Antonio 1]EUD68034.1 hypothetical protein C922_01646 [Plasmodium inui San Antonio 1]
MVKKVVTKLKGVSFEARKICDKRGDNNMRGGPDNIKIQKMPVKKRQINVQDFPHPGRLTPIQLHKKGEKVELVVYRLHPFYDTIKLHNSALGVVAPSMAPPPELLPRIDHLMKLEKDVKKRIVKKEHQMRVTLLFLNVHKLCNPLLTHKKDYRTREIKLGSSNSVLSLAQSSGVRYVLAGLDSGTLHIYNFAYAEKGTGKELPTENMRKCPNDSMDKKIKIWKIRNGDKQPLNKSHTNKKFILSFICEGAFDEHIATRMFHPSVHNNIIIPLSKEVIKIANIVARKSAANNLTRSGKTTRIFKEWTARFTANSEDKNYTEFSSATGMFSHLCSNNCPMLTKNNFQSVHKIRMISKEEEKFYEKNFLKNMNRLRKKKIPTGSS